MISDIATSVAVSLGYLAPNTKLVYTNETGANNEQIKGHYSSQTDTSYVNDKNNDSIVELVNATAHETQHYMDAKSNVIVTDKVDNEKYVNNFVNTVTDYTDYALSYTGNQGMATTNNHNGILSINTPNQTLNIITSSVLSTNNKEFSGVDKRLGEDDILVPVNKRLSDSTDVYVNKKETVEKYEKLGFNVKTPYTKYDLLSFDFNSPQVLESALKQAGFNSIDDFRQAYTNNPNDAKVSEFINKNTPDKNNYIAKDYTYESRQIENGVIGGNGTILGEEAKYAKVNNLQLLNSVTLKQHKLGISDDTSLAISSKILTDGDQEQRKGIDIHSGGCYSSTGCVTSAKIPFSVLNHQKVADELINIAPSLKTIFEPTYIYLPTKVDLAGEKK